MYNIIFYILETRMENSHRNSEESSSNFRFMRLGPFRILGEAYATWRELCRGAEGHAGGWMWFRGSWEGKWGHPSMALLWSLYACH